MSSNVNRPSKTPNSRHLLPKTPLFLQVKTEFSDQPDVYNEFLAIMKNFKAQEIKTPDVIEKVKNLFRGHNNLTLEFNAFLPEGEGEGFKIKLTELNRVSKLGPAWDDKFNGINGFNMNFVLPLAFILVHVNYQFDKYLELIHLGIDKELNDGDVTITLLIKMAMILLVMYLIVLTFASFLGYCASWVFFFREKITDIFFFKNDNYYNVAMYALIMGGAVMGAYENAWEVHFEDAGVLFGYFKRPDVQFNNIHFIDESAIAIGGWLLVGSLNGFLHNWWGFTRKVSNKGESSGGWKVAFVIWAAIAIIINRNHSTKEFAKWHLLPPFGLKP